MKAGTSWRPARHEGRHVMKAGTSWRPARHEGRHVMKAGTSWRPARHEGRHVMKAGTSWRHVWTPRHEGLHVMKAGTSWRPARHERNVKSCNRDVKAQCYQTYVRPIVEYASSVWDPVGEGNSVLRNKLEMVERLAAQFVYNDWKTTSSPSEMIKKLKWQSLEERRNHARLTLMHKYLHKTVDIKEQLATRARCNNTNLVPINARIHTYANSFALQRQRIGTCYHQMSKTKLISKNSSRNCLYWCKRLK